MVPSGALFSVYRNGNNHASPGANRKDRRVNDHKSKDGYRFASKAQAHYLVMIGTFCEKGASVGGRFGQQ